MNKNSSLRTGYQNEGKENNKEARYSVNRKGRSQCSCGKITEWLKKMSGIWLMKGLVFWLHKQLRICPVDNGKSLKDC